MKQLSWMWMFTCVGIISLAGCEKNPVNRLTGLDETPNDGALSASESRRRPGKDLGDNKTYVFHSELKGKMDDGFGNISNMTLTLKVKAKEGAELTGSWPEANRTAQGEGLLIQSEGRDGKIIEQRFVFEKISFSWPIPYTLTSTNTDSEGNTTTSTFTCTDGCPVYYSGQMVVTEDQMRLTLEGLDGSKANLQGEVH